ncbi:hypothetical protein [Hungatella hathewayi]|uniref:hypothetical protein n=1 Tax=Hungatella hathewayi TaxID=154046 RepID=UPI003562F02E
MKIEKIKKVTYEINPPVWRLKLTVGTLIKGRQLAQIDYHPFETCFLCHTKLDEDFMPNVAMVKGLGNRCFCDKCTMKINMHEEEENDG